MSNQFQKATKKRAKARVAIDGPSGAGKTFSALIAARVLAEGGKIAVIDTERGSASLYSDKFNFDVLELETFSPQLYINAIEAAEAEGYAVIVIDSLSHAWEGEGGALDLVDKAAKRSQSGNSFTAWKDVTPLQRKMVDTILQSRCHVVVTMRSKMEYVQEKDERTNKTTIRKVGMAPIQRQGMEYEFTIVADMDIDHNLSISKSRCEALADAVVNKPDDKFFKKLLDWLNDGAASAPSSAAERVPASPVPSPAAPAKPADAVPSTQPAATTTPATPITNATPTDPNILALAAHWPADAKVSWEMAQTVTSSDKKKTPYVQIPAEKLVHIINSITTKLRANNLTPEERAEIQLKHDTARTLLQIHAAA